MSYHYPVYNSSSAPNGIEYVTLRRGVSGLYYSDGTSTYYSNQPIYYGTIAQPIQSSQALPLYQTNQQIYCSASVPLQLQPIQSVQSDWQVTRPAMLKPEEYKYIAYKSAGEYIITLGIPADALTNMNRKDIVNKEYAKYRTNKVHVLDINHKNTEEKIKSIQSDYDVTKIYEVGTQIVANFDNNIDNICSAGIHFYLLKELAFSYEYCPGKSRSVVNKEYKVIDAYDNGLVTSEIFIKNEKAIRQIQYLYYDTTLKEKIESIYTYFDQ